jgi:leucyl-tRNA synthetase
LPLLLPQVDQYQPGPEGEGPLANIPEWVNVNDNNLPYQGGQRETNTMPGYAGSSWYFLRYMDPSNQKEFCSKQASDYWGQVDLYVGGTEHAVGHLLYSRMWTKALYDLGLISFDEPFRKLLNQGMIQGSSRFVYRLSGTNTFVSKGLLDHLEMYEGQKTDKLHVDVNMVDGFTLDLSRFRQWRNSEFTGAEFILEGSDYICGSEVEKMSKSKFNTVNPDDIVEKFGADTFRMYEMFLGPVEISKPWDTKGIEGVHRFLKKLWRLFYDELKGQVWNQEVPTDEEWKALHKTIKKIDEDTERFSFNTAVSTFMICVNELHDLKSYKKAILDKLLILLAPYAPHIAAELWEKTGNQERLLDAAYPAFEEKYLKETAKLYPIAVNGKTRSECLIALDATQEQVEQLVLADPAVQKWMEGKSPKKIIYVKNKMINIVM